MVNKQADRSRQRAREDYLKAIYHLGEGEPVKAVDLSRHLRVSRASVSKLRRVLEKDGLIATARNRLDALRLTVEGLAIAVRMVRRHRLVETFLHRSLAVPLHRVHTDAERIEHTISDDIARRLADFLGNPDSDPHGHRIPHSPSQQLAIRDMPLPAAQPGHAITITAVDDSDSKVMRKLEELGVLPGFRARVVASDAHAMRLRSGRRTLALPRAIALSVRCTIGNQTQNNG